ncbi:MAG: DMT family transporter [Lachnospiraceae bacterium]|nr:DMT family transporter [Lachnospiraceae bacterium]
MWVWLTLSYGLIKGTREIVKKKSLTKSTVMEVLFFYTLFGFLLLIPDAVIAMNKGEQLLTVSLSEIGVIALKSFIIFLAWMASFHAIKKIPLSLYGLLDLSRVLFATLLGVLVLKETLYGLQIVGLILVATGLIMLKLRKNKDEQEIRVIYILFAFASCLLNAVSGLMDKILMKDMSPKKMQLWYMLFLMLFYLLYILVRRIKIDIKGALKNYWIWILSILFIIADRALFLANADGASRVTVMTLIKQSGCLVTILAGKFIFKEKGIGYKLICAAIIIAGIVLGVMAKAS